MPTFGETDEGNSTVYIANLNGKTCIRGGFFSPSSNGQVTSMHVRSSVTYGTVDLECAVYEYVDWTSDFAGDCLGSSQVVEMDSTNNVWYQFDMINPVSVVAGTKYYLLVRATEEVGANNNIAGWTYGGDNNFIYKCLDGGSGPVTFDSPLTGEADAGNDRISIYATYTESAGTARSLHIIKR